MNILDSENDRFIQQKLESAPVQEKEAVFRVSWVGWLVRLSGYFQAFVLLLKEILSFSMIVYLWKIVD